MSDHGVGMPHALKLHLWALDVANVFGTHSVYQVGSSVHRRDYHDVDVRVLLPDDEYDRWFAPCPTERHTHASPRWVGVTLAFSLWGQQATGLPIDFQVQRIDEANEMFADKDNLSNRRSCLTMGWIFSEDTSLRQPFNRDVDDREYLARQHGENAHGGEFGMSDPRTEVVIDYGIGYAFFGHVSRELALRDTRAYYERELKKAQKALAALDAGEVKVYHQRGVYVIKNRREVLP